mgnify:CR=1 FL=1
MRFTRTPTRSRSSTIDVTVALFDSLNHLPSTSDLRDTFRSAAVATIPGGPLLFDLNTRLGLDRWNGIQVDESKEWLVVVRGVYSPEMPRGLHSSQRVSGRQRKLEKVLRGYL